MNRNTFQIVAAISIFCASGCKSSPAPISQTLPSDLGANACKVTTTRGELSMTTRRVFEAGQIREIVDETGDGQPNRVLTSTLDADRRPSETVTTLPNGTVLARERYTWEGPRLVRAELDKLDATGLPGADGTADEIRTLSWDGDNLVRETWDQLSADGLLGTDGKPELATDWTWKDGNRVRGVKTDLRDESVLETVALVWVMGQIALQTIDLGGDGTIDATIKNSWADDKLQQQIVEGPLDASTTTFEYCR